ncbi:two-component hybrid sensor and regulator [Acetobacter pasteurianus NBRC 101655]|uniref:histidine kinase n=2 Tax=Acetobacter pasteurianus TaxID=438 RepID=C7JB36_ACEP3|nr:ATP-binding protein [Acetobacter pasteurianus]BAH98312.1 two component hybrid sensor histidine kinase and regulator [Acetobacter pasteurianus IFO 3283-01]BAI01363.1 two component hybrid sensor histidine kinase and regulator [Acetobacter pasteurianus IFO 3283-03]BAI04411.1 two component hybrid sensor histidine kinase and regulator [Acetobacter pasteurianus IFO 3283-07]BAI07458.1 two component hybrid sensor histidine kinase and regulator [Acetobacter pasteurianus IFO 3283-22]BAI10506.1 two co
MFTIRRLTYKGVLKKLFSFRNRYLLYIQPISGPSLAGSVHSVVGRRMFPHQRIIRSRRTYNRWVADETMEDYALRFTPAAARRWSPLSVANTAFGGVSFLALEMIGGIVFLKYGFPNACLALLLGVVLIFLLSLPISYYSSRFGIDLDLLTRGAGFGYIGSTLTSLIYASFTFIFFAIEGAILSDILKMCLGIPLWLGYIFSALVIIPIVAKGFTLISRFQRWTVAPWLILQLLPFLVIAWKHPAPVTNWMHYAGYHELPVLELAGIGGALSIIFSVITQIGEQADFLRFLPLPQQPRQKWTWWAVLLVCGAGWIFPGGLKILAGMFLAWIAIIHGVQPTEAQQPTTMYLLAFQQVTSIHGFAFALAIIFIVLSQLKINITNAYAGSIAWSNFFSRMTHSHPGRIVWVIFNVGLGLLLMEMDVYSTIVHMLFLHSTIAASWIGALTSDLIINKPLGFSPKGIEFRRAYLYDINPVGMGSMTGGLLIAAASYTGVFGSTVSAFSPFMGLTTSFLLVPLIGWLTEGRYYLARSPLSLQNEKKHCVCVVCQNTFEQEDIAFCPVYTGFICSLCCTLDSRCHDACKPETTRLTGQIKKVAYSFLPRSLAFHISGVIGRYFLIFSALLFCAGIILYALYQNIVKFPHISSYQLSIIFWKTFFLLSAPLTVIAWFLVLSQRSYRAAENENRFQTRLLMKEIRAHKRTDQELKKAKERAEAANLSKSRFMVGVSHEIRTPLNSIMGYAYLLENKMLAPEKQNEGLKVIQRSAEHLSGLIEGLFDISKIEAGRLDILHDKINFQEFLKHLTGMLRFQVNNKKLVFIEDIPENLPEYVMTDQRRLRQILINLLSNAIKFTPSGSVSFSVRWNMEIATFEIRDTGIGIPDSDIERIQEPFQRSSHPDSHRIQGTGLGLTITRLLVQILGGEFTIKSTVGQGTTCRVRLMLSQTESKENPPSTCNILVHEGSRRPTVFVIDDDSVHRGMINDILEPFGFLIYSAGSGQECLEIAQHMHIDIFLIDINMPGMNGWELARHLRKSINHNSTILVISADEQTSLGNNREELCNSILSKPVSIPDLLLLIGQTLNNLTLTQNSSKESHVLHKTLHEKDLSELRRLSRIGHVAGIVRLLDKIDDSDSEDIQLIRDMANQSQIHKLQNFLDSYEERS